MSNDDTFPSSDVANDTQEPTQPSSSDTIKNNQNNDLDKPIDQSTKISKPSGEQNNEAAPEPENSQATIQKTNQTTTEKQDIDTTPLCVDLDGTLIQSDLSVESALRAIKIKPWILLWFPFWLRQGLGY